MAKAAGDELGMDADVIQVDDVDLDDDEVQGNDPDTELMDLINSLKTGSMIEKKQSMQKLRSIAGGEESFARTVRDHKYQHDVKSYRLGIRKDRRRAEDRMKYLKTSPIKKQYKRSNVDVRPGWGVGEQKWFVSKTETPDRIFEFNITHREGVGDIEESKEQRLAPGELSSARQGHAAKIEHPWKELQKTIDAEFEGQLTKFAVQNFHLQSSIERQNEILENLAKDPNFIRGTPRS